MSLDNQVKQPADGQWSNYSTSAGWNDASASGPSEPPGPQDEDHSHHGDGSSQGHGMHKWGMLLMCVPLVLIGLWQLFSGAGFGSLLGGLACMGMMLVMHLGMGNSSHHRH